MTASSMQHTDFPRSSWALVTGALVLLAVHSSAAGPLALGVRSGPHWVELSWPAVQQGSDGRIERPWFELQRSTDLRTWEPLGERVRAGSTAPGEILNQRVSAPADSIFYRLLVVLSPNAVKLADGGAEVFGYADALSRKSMSASAPDRRRRSRPASASRRTIAKAFPGTRPPPVIGMPSMPIRRSSTLERTRTNPVTVISTPGSTRASSYSSSRTVSW